MAIVPANVERDWMEAAPQKFPYRCLPLNIANQNGWMVLSPVSFEAYWYGGMDRSEIEIRFADESDPRITSHFGVGVLTFSLPYLFRTPPGINLWVKGPSNVLKDGIQALEGIVETDWSPATFTMNWRFTRPFEWITFQKGEPFCMILPIPRGLTESMTAERRAITSDPALKLQFEKWEEGRRTFLHDLLARDSAAVARGWQKDYFQGKMPDGAPVDAHQTRLHIRPFADPPAES
jgi:hypothetical protein